MLGIDGKEKPKFAEGDLVEFKVGTVLGKGHIRGISILSVIDYWIVEIIGDVGIDRNTYPYSCIVLPHTFLKRAV